MQRGVICSRCWFGQTEPATTWKHQTMICLVRASVWSEGAFHNAEKLQSLIRYSFAVGSCGNLVQGRRNSEDGLPSRVECLPDLVRIQEEAVDLLLEDTWFDPHDPFRLFAGQLKAPRISNPSSSSSSSSLCLCALSIWRENLGFASRELVRGDELPQMGCPLRPAVYLVQGLGFRICG